jgi:hypothetical protein
MTLNQSGLLQLTEVSRTADGGPSTFAGLTGRRVRLSLPTPRWRVLLYRRTYVPTLTRHLRAMS